MYGFLNNKRFDRWTAVFFDDYSIGQRNRFLLPVYASAPPPIKLGVISLVVLFVTIVTRYPLHLRWRKTYVVTACTILYFNVFVLVVQSFEKVPTLKATAPTRKEWPFAIPQIAVLAAFIVLTAIALKKFRDEPTAKSNATAA